MIGIVGLEGDKYSLLIISDLSTWVNIVMAIAYSIELATGFMGNRWVVWHCLECHRASCKTILLHVLLHYEETSPECSIVNSGPLESPGVLCSS